MSIKMNQCQSTFDLDKALQGQLAITVNGREVRIIKKAYCEEQDKVVGIIGYFVDSNEVRTWNLDGSAKLIKPKDNLFHLVKMKREYPKLPLPVKVLENKCYYYYFSNNVSINARFPNGERSVAGYQVCINKQMYLETGNKEVKEFLTLLMERGQLYWCEADALEWLDFMKNYTK